MALIEKVNIQQYTDCLCNDNWSLTHFEETKLMSTNQTAIVQKI